ncbi:MAG: Flp family type IVb pilin [Alphaproteobacteria bacterium]|nr:Flp family type IVb pilin [Alphaproteobacteria bacterium]
MSFIRRLYRDETGATSLEYALILALAAVISIPSFEALGSNVSLVMNKVAYAECQASDVLCIMTEPN